MTEIQIKPNGICFDRRVLNLGMSYAQIARLLAPLAVSGKEPGKTGVGFLTIPDVFCWGLMGECVLQFREFALASLTVRPDWRRYDLRGLSHAQGIEKVARLSREGLERTYGPPVARTSRGSWTHLVGSCAVRTGISPHGETYTLEILSVPMANPRDMGYALAPKRLVQRRQKVCFCYRETGDDRDDSGWRFFAGDETDAYVNDPGNIGLYPVSAIAAIDPDVLPLLALPAGVAFERQQPTELFRASRPDV